MGALPPLRFLVRPEPGFGLEARIPMGRHVQCYFAAEAYIHGGSAVRFGLEPRRFPYLRLQAAPATTVSVRVPLLAMSEFKAVLGGAQLTLFDAGRWPRPAAGAAFWRGLRDFVRPVVELQHQGTLLGTFLDSEQRRMLREAALELKKRREAREARRVGERRIAVRGFDPPEMPSLDPRVRPDPFARLREQLRERYGEDGIVKNHDGREAWESASGLQLGSGVGGGAGRRKHSRSSTSSSEGNGGDGGGDGGGGGGGGGSFCTPPAVGPSARAGGQQVWRLGHFPSPSLHQ